VYEVFQVQAHAQLKEAVLLQLMALQSTPAMIGARTLPGLTAPLLQHMTLQATPGNDCGTHPAVADGTFAVADDAASNADAVVADVLVGVSTLAAAGDAASNADTVVADASVGISTLAGDAASDADTVVAEALVGVSTLAAAGHAASDAGTVVADAECSDDGSDFTDSGDQVEADNISVAVNEGETESQIEAAKAADASVQSAAAEFKANGGFGRQLCIRAADEDQDQPLLMTPPGSPRRRLTRAAPASMPYMTLRRGGLPCSQGEGSNACDVCAEAGAGNSARIAALKHTRRSD
jgi:hypothetical protein